MNERKGSRIDEVRGEPLDELKFLSHLLVDRFYEKLPPEFWQHARAARHELRLALIILLRAALEHLSRELEEEKNAPPVSAQRGKIVVEAAFAPPPPPAAAPPPPAPAPSLLTERNPVPLNGNASRQRGKISLD